MPECVSGGHEAYFKATNPDGTVWYFCPACGSCAGPADDVKVVRLEQTIEQQVRAAIGPINPTCTSHEAAVRRIMEIIERECEESRQLGYGEGRDDESENH